LPYPIAKQICCQHREQRAVQGAQAPVKLELRQQQEDRGGEEFYRQQQGGEELAVAASLARETQHQERRRVPDQMFISPMCPLAGD